jgi:hypothetical protein
MSVSKTKPSVSKIDEQQKRVEYQSNHLEQAFTHFENLFEIELEKEHKDIIKVIIMKTILLSEETQELNLLKLELANDETKRQEFWKTLN